MEYIGLIAGKSGDSLTEEIQKRGYKVALVAGKENEPGTDTADEVLITDLGNKEEIYKFFNFLNLKYLIIGTGHILALETAKYLEKKGIILSINIEKSFLCKDKYLFKKEIEKLGYLTPKYILCKKEENEEENLKKILENFNFPIVLKSPIDKREPVAVNNFSELKEYYEIIKKLDSDILVEEYIVGSDITIPTIHDGTVTKSLGILYWTKGKEEKLKGFENTKSYKIKDENIVLKVVENIIHSLNVIGMSRTDIVVTDDFKIYILEINSIVVCGHTGSTYYYAWKNSGFNFAYFTVKNAFSIFGLLENNL